MMKNIRKFVLPCPIISILILWAITFICLGCTPIVAVRRGSDIISKQVFYKPKDKVDFLRFPENLTSSYGSDLIILSRAYKNPNEHRLSFVSKDGKLKSTIFLDYYDLRKIFLVDIGKDGIYKFFSFSQGKVFLLNIRGQIIWEFSPIKLDNIWDIHLGFGELDGDGFVEFVAAYVKKNDESTIVYILDHHGNLKSQIILPEDRFNFRYMKVLDTNDDTNCEIVCNGISGIHIFNSKGKLLRSFKPEWDGWQLSLWNNKNNNPLIYGQKGKSLLFTNLKGKTVGELPLSKGGLDFLRAPAKSVFLKKIGDEPFVAATRKIPYVYDRSYFYIFDPSGKLIYEEVLPARIDEIFPILEDDTKKEFLLVSVLGTIWAYKLK